MSNYYAPSGKFSNLSILYFILAALIAFPILGLIYSYCIWYIPFVYINFFITAGFGFALGWLISFLVINLGKVRNTSMATLFGALGGLIAIYFHWAVWVDLVINVSSGSESDMIATSNIKIFEVFSLAQNPGVLFSLIKEINGFGTWGIVGGAVSGTFLTLIWLVEFIIIMAISTLLPMGAARKPFSETDDSWFEEQQLAPFIFIDAKEKLIADIEEADVEAFQAIGLSENPDQNHSIFTLYDSKEGISYLTIENNTGKINDDGKVEFESDQIVEFIALSHELREALLAKLPA